MCCTSHSAAAEDPFAGSHPKQQRCQSDSMFWGEQTGFFPIKATCRKPIPGLCSPELCLMLLKIPAASGCLQVSIQFINLAFCS